MANIDIREGFVPPGVAPKEGELRWGCAPGAEPTPFSHPPRLEDDCRLEMFEEEVVAFEKIKKNHPQLCSHFTDRFICCALLQWYLDEEKAVNVLQTNLTFRKRMGMIYPGQYPSLSEFAKIFLGIGFGIPGARAHNGMSLLFGSMEGFSYPPNFNADDARWMTIFMCMYIMESERLDACRKGMMWVSDLGHLGWSSFNQTFEEAAAEVYQDTFPMRWGKMMILNPPFIMRPIMAIAKLFIKSKIMDRIEMADHAQMKAHIHSSHIPSQFKGGLQYRKDDFCKHLDVWSQGYWYHRTEPVKHGSLPSCWHPGDFEEDDMLLCCGLKKNGEQDMGEGCACRGCGRSLKPFEPSKHALSARKAALACPGGAASSTCPSKWNSGCLCIKENGEKWR